MLVGKLLFYNLCMSTICWEFSGFVGVVWREQKHFLIQKYNLFLVVCLYKVAHFSSVCFCYNPFIIVLEKNLLFIKSLSPCDELSDTICIDYLS